MRFGAHAEYICLPENGSLAIKPAHLSHNEAAAIPFGGVTALHFIRKANINAGQKVLVVGASGAVGTAAVQLAKSYGAHVTAVCSTANIDMVRSIRADKLIDYTKEGFTQNGELYDVIIDTVNTISVAKAAGSLSKNGVMILSAAGTSEMLHGAWISKTSRKKVMTGVISHSAEDLATLKGLIEDGKFKPVIDRAYPLAQIAEAHTYVEKGHKKGNVIIDTFNSKK
jgi:NADPH:quinone reductase-like Zn-dependent oxidoreductase